MEKYKARVRYRLSKLYGVQFDLFFTLTVDPKMFSFLYEEFAWIAKQWCRLRAWLYKYYGKFSFVKVLEITRKGRPHLHVLVKGIKAIRGEYLRRFQGVWSAFVKVKACFKGFSAGSYVMKYVNKTIAGKDLLFCALLFASNRRMFSISRDLCTSPFSKGADDVDERRLSYYYRWLYGDLYQWDGTCLQHDLDVFLKEKGMECGREVIVLEKVNREDVYKFPEVFGVAV